MGSYRRLRAAIGRFLSRGRHGLFFVVAIALAVGPDLLAKLEGQPLSLATLARGATSVVLAGLVNGRLVPVLRRFYRKQVDAVLPPEEPPSGGES